MDERNYIALNKDLNATGESEEMDALYKADGWQWRFDTYTSYTKYITGGLTINVSKHISKDKWTVTLIEDTDEVYVNFDANLN